MKSIEHICVMCGHKEKEGIFIQGGFICDDCEEDIVHTEVEDEKYHYFVQQLKQLWLKNA
ncbi:sigma factor G inhibitor Gin [Tepidibacillus fermentans]|uniref:Inhibitor of sigma-G Gin protein n=1 Tax=Tepidibacillus fermentans TaxID=1281767 RepID=A0A4R3K5F4_9BACI|nr:sigma factor G inhibitor Gin [Tepidibacillus fermentans]TCS77950.1 inhibitor of sigma-G Gin protein [Tepidibacillus fermentans]